MGRVLICVVVAGATLFARQSPVFRGGAETVPVFVTVSDKSGRLVPDLTRDDFQILDNGKPQPLAVFDNRPQPIRVVVLVDVSGSMAGNLTLLRAASAALIDHFGPNDLAKFGTFGDRIEIGPHFTRDVSELARSLPTFIPPNAPTPLWEAVDQAMSEFSGTSGRDAARGGAEPPGAKDGRPVVLIMSDGKDSPPPAFRRKWFNQVDEADRAEREDIMIYGIGVYSRMMPGGDIRQQIVGRFPDPGLGSIAESTGGGYYELHPRDDLGEQFARIADELHHQYLLAFSPPSRDGKPHKIEVKVSRKDTKVRSRKGYRAPK